MKKHIFLALSLIPILNAQDLKTSILEVINTNPTILERLKNYNSTKEDITTAKAGFYPSIDLSIGGGFQYTQRENTRDVGAKDIITDQKGKTVNSIGLAVYQNSLTYTQNLFKGWQTTYQVQEQEDRTISAAFSYIENVNDISFKLTEAYLELLKQEELLATAKDDVNITEEILQKVQKLYDAGLTTLSEANKVEASLSLAKSNMTVQENTVLDKTYQFHRVFGRYIDPKEMQKPDLLVALPATIEDAAQIAMDNNPSLLVAKYDVKLAQATYKEKKSPFYPSVDLVLSANANKNLSGSIVTENSAQAMLYLKYNLFNGFYDTASLQKSVSEIHKEVYIKDKLRRETIEGLNLSWASNEKLSNQIEFLTQYKDFSKQTLDLYSKEYDLGRRSLLDLLSAQGDYIKSQNQIINTEYNLLYSKYRILDAMGTLVSTILGDDKNQNIHSNVGIQSATPDNTDDLPIHYDTDLDLIVDEDDICNNSLSDKLREVYGCMFIFEDTIKIERYSGFLFNDDDIKLSSDGRDRLNKLIKQLNPYGFEYLKFDIFGNISEEDSEGMTQKEMLDITTKRANTAKQILIDAGAKEEYIVIHPMGNTSPMYSDETTKGMDLNNRVDIAVRKLKK